MGSCFPGKEISFDVLQPSEYQVPKDIDSILVLNLSYYPWIDTSEYNILKNLSNSERYIVDTVIINSVFDGLFSVIDSSPMSVLRGNHYYEERGNTSDNFLDTLDIQSVNYLCDEFNVSLILSLEYYTMNYNYDTYFDYNSSNIFESYVTDLELNKGLFWRIYQKELGIIYENNRKDTLYWSARGNSVEKSKAALPNLFDVMKEAFFMGGESFGNELSPEWETLQRSYYQLYDDKGQDKSLNEAFLMNVISKDKKVKSFKAWYNLALVYEREGDLHKALDAINSAELLHPNSEYVKFYKGKLDESIEKRARLLEQIGD